MLKLLICDFDDTLVDELKFVESGFAECARVFAPQFPDLGTSGLLNLFRREFAVSRSGVFDRAFGSIGGSNAATLAARAVDTYRYTARISRTMKMLSRFLRKPNGADCTQR